MPGATTRTARPEYGNMGPGPGGETGIRMGLKIPRPQGHAGSTPAPGTIRFLRRSGAGKFHLQMGSRACCRPDIGPSPPACCSR